MRENTTFRKFRSLIWFAVLASFACPSYAQNPIDSFPSVAQSKAYHLFKSKTDTDFAKLLFLIDRFEHSGIQVVYEGHYFDGIFAAKIARWFLARKYRKETPEDWIMRWCNTSLGGQLIYVKFPDGKFRLSREVLFDELKAKLHSSDPEVKKNALETARALKERMQERSDELARKHPHLTEERLNPREESSITEAQDKLEQYRRGISGKTPAKRRKKTNRQDWLVS